MFFSRFCKKIFFFSQIDGVTNFFAEICTFNTICSARLQYSRKKNVNKVG